MSRETYHEITAWCRLAFGAVMAIHALSTLTDTSEWMLSVGVALLLMSQEARRA